MHFDATGPIRQALGLLSRMADAGADPDRLAHAAGQVARDLAVAADGDTVRLEYLVDAVRKLLSIEVGLAERRWDHLSRACQFDTADAALRTAEGFAQAHEVLSTVSMIALALRGEECGPAERSGTPLERFPERRASSGRRRGARIALRVVSG